VVVLLSLGGLFGLHRRIVAAFLNLLAHAVAYLRIAPKSTVRLLIAGLRWLKVAGRLAWMQSTGHLPAASRPVGEAMLARVFARLPVYVAICLVALKQGGICESLGRARLWGKPMVASVYVAACSPP